MTKDELIENIKDFFADTSRLTKAILAILIFFILSATILLLVNSAKGRKKPQRQLPPVEFTKDEEFIPPQSSTFTEDYYFSRTTGEKWDQEQVDQWFTIPGTATVEELGRDNDTLVQEILGAAP